MAALMRASGRAVKYFRSQAAYASRHHPAATKPGIIPKPPNFSPVTEESQRGWEADEPSAG